MTGPVVHPDVDETALRVLAEALGFNYDSAVAPVTRQGITLGDVRRALAKYPALASAVGEQRNYAVAINGRIHNFATGFTLDQHRRFVEMCHPSVSCQIVQLVDTPESLGIAEFQRREAAKAASE